MLTLPEWCQLVGLQGRNPFAYKQADAEQEWLEACFVEHPAYNALVSEAEPRSSILHAARGAGKTTTCTMFERLCREEAAHRRPLVVRLHEWIPLVDLLDQPLHTQVNGYLEALFAQVTFALAATCDAPWIQAPADASLRTFLAWFCTRYAVRLTDEELAHLVHGSRLLCEPPLEPPPSRLLDQPPLQQVRWLVRALRAAHVQTVYVLIDRVDEVAVTVAHPERGADLLLPLIGNLELLELEGLVVKCFIPTPIVAVLRERGQLREDRINCYDLTWLGEQGPELLRRLLHNRLSHFSNGAVQSLAALADVRLRDIDDRIVRAADGSPRRLLVLGEQLLLARAADASARDLLIQPRHLDQALGSAVAGVPPDVAAEHQPATPVVSGAAAGPAPEPIRDADGAPLLTLGADGCIARGGTPIAEWQHLPSRQRNVIRYLFSKAGVICHYSELGRAVWNDAQVSDDTVRKVMDRLIAFLHKDYAGPSYIEKITGGYYVLQHAVAVTHVGSEIDPASDASS